MAKTNIKSIIQSDIDNVWETVLAVKNYNKWRSDVSKTEIINEKKFIEYTKDGYSTTFTVTFIKPLNRWEFDMENSNMLSKLIERIEVYTSEKNEGIKKQKVVIYYNCIGSIEIPDELPIPEPDVALDTRKGITLTYTPVSATG